jgi:uncharacterized protein (TIGR00251 family)
MTRDEYEGVQLGVGEGFFTLPVVVKPSGRANRVVGVHDGALKVEVTAPPERGRANDMLVRLLAGLFGVPRRAVTVVQGQGSRRKVLRVEGTDGRRALDRAVAGGKEKP